jgi:hypothetical protein
MRPGVSPRQDLFISRARRTSSYNCHDATVATVASCGASGVSQPPGDGGITHPPTQQNRCHQNRYNPYPPKANPAPKTNFTFVIDGPPPLQTDQHAPTLPKNNESWKFRANPFVLETPKRRSQSQVAAKKKKKQGKGCITAPDPSSSNEEDVIGQYYNEFYQGVGEGYNRNSSSLESRSTTLTEAVADTQGEKSTRPDLVPSPGSREATYGLSCDQSFWVEGEDYNRNPSSFGSGQSNVQVNDPHGFHPSSERTSCLVVTHQESTPIYPVNNSLEGATMTRDVRQLTIMTSSTHCSQYDQWHRQFTYYSSVPPFHASSFLAHPPFKNLN